ncbi:MAG: F0F1 ATP synthase subunit epsilon [Bacteroidota bacterium]
MLVVDILTPEANVFSGEVVSVTLPGLDGIFQVLPNHAPIISALKQGTLKVELTNSFDSEQFKSKLISTTGDSKKIEITINGGVAELTNNKMIVLAE